MSKAETALDLAWCVRRDDAQKRLAAIRADAPEQIERLTRERNKAMDMVDHWTRRSVRERDRAQKAEAEQAAMVKVIEPWVCKSLREDGPIACNTCEAVIEECRFQLATHALDNLTPAAARMVRIENAAKRYARAEKRWQDAMDNRSPNDADMAAHDMEVAKSDLLQAVRGEGEKP
jgi:hypothetical protein